MSSIGGIDLLLAVVIVTLALALAALTLLGIPHAAAEIEELAANAADALRARLGAKLQPADLEQRLIAELDRSRSHGSGESTVADKYALWLHRADLEGLGDISRVALTFTVALTRAAAQRGDRFERAPSVLLYADLTASEGRVRTGHARWPAAPEPWAPKRRPVRATVRTVRWCVVLVAKHAATLVRLLARNIARVVRKAAPPLGARALRAWRAGTSATASALRGVLLGLAIMSVVAGGAAIARTAGPLLGPAIDSLSTMLARHAIVPVPPPPSAAAIVRASPPARSLAESPGAATTESPPPTTRVRAPASQAPDPARTAAPVAATVPNITTVAWSNGGLGRIIHEDALVDRLGPGQVSLTTTGKGTVAGYRCAAGAPSAGCAFLNIAVVAHDLVILGIDEGNAWHGSTQARAAPERVLRSKIPEMYLPPNCGVRRCTHWEVGVLIDGRRLACVLHLGDSGRLVSVGVVIGREADCPGEFVAEMTSAPSRVVTEWWVPPRPDPCGIEITERPSAVPAGAVGTRWYLRTTDAPEHVRRYRQTHPHCTAGAGL